MKQWINMGLLLTVAVFSLWCTGDLMRKADQAAILAGAVDLADGQAQPMTAYYQYDKTYVLYWACAGLVRLKQMLAPAASPIAFCNRGLAFVFWASLAAFVFRFRKMMDPVVLLSFLAAPAVLLNTLYVNSSVLSSAWILLCACMLFARRRHAGNAAAVLFFAAVGSRADAALLLPLMIWMITPLETVEAFVSRCAQGWRCGLNGLGLFSNGWKLIAAGGLALVLGPVLCGGAGVALDPVFNFKMVAGYTVFGFGAAAAVFLLYSAQMLQIAVRQQTWLARFYYLAGFFALTLPVIFFLPQLHAPRYFWRGCEALLLLAVSQRLPTVSGLQQRWIRSGVCIAAVVPLFVGTQMPELRHPQVTVTDAQRFPSGDGSYPMGATLSFMLQLKNAGECPIDHNQLVWNAAQTIRFNDDPVYVLSTPMSAYLLLSASLQRRTACRLPFEKIPAGCGFYADSRSLMRDDPKTPLSFMKQVLALPSHFVSDQFCGVGVLWFGAGDFVWNRQTALLNRLFGGNEYRLLDSPDERTGYRHAAAFSDRPFDGGIRDKETGLFFRTDDRAENRQGVAWAEAVWPEWMAIRAFSGK